MKLSQIIQQCQLEFKDWQDIEISGLNSLHLAKSNELTFALKDSPELANTNAAAVLVSHKIAHRLNPSSLPLVCDDPKYYFALISALFVPAPAKNAACVHPSAIIEPGAIIKNGAIIGENSIISANVYVGENVRIGKGVLIHPGVVIYANSIISDNCIIHANAVIGSDGFGYASNAKGHFKIHHLGRVELEENVEIGACVCIDRAVFERTIIKSGSKIDNLVQIGHNCELGRGCIIVSQTGLAGSSILGDGVIMGGQSATSGHLKITSNTTIAARGGVSKSIEQPGVYGGFPLLAQNDWLKLQAKLSRAFLKD